MIQRLGLCMILVQVMLSSMTSLGLAIDRDFPIGDTLTVIQRPLLNVPNIVSPGETFSIFCSTRAAESDT